MEKTFQAVRQASRTIALLDDDTINDVLLAVADQVEARCADILVENKKDLARMAPDDPKFDRLKLTANRIEDIAQDMRNVAELPSPVGLRLEHATTASGLSLEKISVPLGVIGVIYEARPNVTLDVFALCLKSGNACVLKGGSDAEYSNKIIVKIIRAVLKSKHINEDCITLLPTDRAATHALLHAVGLVDVIIPRGSQSLIDYVRDNAKVPVIETGAGIVHTYFDEHGDVAKGADIIFNAKTRRVSVCNALDCLIVHVARLRDLSELVQRLAEKNVHIYADELAYNSIHDTYPKELLSYAGAEHFGIEFLDYKMSIKIVASLAEACDHIDRYSSRHSEAIITEDEQAANTFLKQVDAAAVYANASTAFTDGAQFGLGAEIGISTQKLHARGPMGLREMTSYKWIIKGNGTVRIP